MLEFILVIPSIYNFEYNIISIIETTSNLPGREAGRREISGGLDPGPAGPRGLGRGCGVRDELNL